MKAVASLASLLLLAASPSQACPSRVRRRLRVADRWRNRHGPPLRRNRGGGGAYPANPEFDRPADSVFCEIDPTTPRHLTNGIWIPDSACRSNSGVGRHTGDPGALLSSSENRSVSVRLRVSASGQPRRPTQSAPDRRNCRGSRPAARETLQPWIVHPEGEASRARDRLSCP